MKEKLLVTGGKGLVGSAIEAEVKLGREFDLVNAQETDQAFKMHNPTHVIHCAGKVGGVGGNMNFKGVGIYIDADVMNKDFSHLFLYLDTNDDVAIYKPKSVILFNCGSTNCKKLIPEIVAESTDNYLNKFLWANKISTIPNHIGEGL